MQYTTMEMEVVRLYGYCYVDIRATLYSFNMQRFVHVSGQLQWVSLDYKETVR